ncbi:MAG: ribonuclease P protein component [Gemmatimonadaceae bacterium]
MTGFRFPRAYRLTRRADLLSVARDGKRIRTEALEFRAVASLLHPGSNPQSGMERHARVGLIVPKHGNGIVHRNQLKRRLREIVRYHFLRELPAIDVVIRAQRQAYKAGFANLVVEVEMARRKLVTMFSEE